MEKNYDIYNKMQELLPDYCFNRINEEDKRFFESNIESFPDLQKEIEDVKAVFAKIDELDFDGIISRKTRNLSVKVNKRLKKDKPAVGRSFMKYLVPTFGIAILMFAAFYVFKPGDRLEPANKALPEFMVLNPNDESKLFDSTMTGEELIDLSQYLNNSLTSDDILLASRDTANIEIADNLIMDNIKDADDVFMVGIPSEHYSNILDEIDNVDESDLQGILKDIKNAQDFN